MKRIAPVVVAALVFLFHTSVGAWDEHGHVLEIETGRSVMDVIGQVNNFPATADAGNMQYLSVEEGTYVGGAWQMRRRWNGDQTDYGLNFTGQPVLLSETAVGPVAGQEAKIQNLFAGMRHYGTLGLVWFDISQNDGLYHQDWHIEHSLAAEKAFRREAAALALTRP